MRYLSTEPCFAEIEAEAIERAVETSGTDTGS